MNKTERLLYQKHNLSDEERNQVLKLMNCGLPVQEIAEIMHISKSSVNYIRQAHTACLAKDWDTLQNLSVTGHRAAVDWAMKLTGVDKVFNETFGEPKKETPKDEPTEAVEPVVNPITREDFVTLSNTLQDICYLLTEIRDMLK